MNFITVNTKQGPVRGKISKNYKNGTFYSFFGIPYAEPPLGQLRFKAPRPPKPWEGILDATREKSGCIGPNTYTGKIEGTEDCLHLNIYTPEIGKDEPLNLKPVLVFIHGGAFLLGNTKTEIYGPDFLLTEDVVLVLVSYRLGALGWSRLEDPSLGVPGNQGIRDVTMALKWIREHIKYFCGDPTNVTLFGESAGAVLVHCMMFSPSCKNLFHKLIIHSGSSLVHWATGRKDSIKELARYLKCPSEVDKDILEFLQNQPLEKIIEAQLKTKIGIKPSLPRHFYPVIEDTPNSEEPVIPCDPRISITRGEYIKVPMLIGYTSEEGLFFDYQIRSKLKRDKYAEIITDFEEFVPHPLGFKKGSAESKRIAENIKLFYFGGKNPTIADRKQFFKLVGDNYYYYFLQDTARRHLKTLGKPIYFFKFSVDAELNMYKKLQGVDFPGATHSDELGYLFKMSKNPPVKDGSVEDKTIQRMVKLWTNFAKKGNPNVEESSALIDVKWKEIEEDKLNYLNIDRELSTGIDPDKRGVDFWDKMYNMSPISKL